MVIGEEAGSAASLPASMRVTETESLLECRDPNEPRTLSKFDQVGLSGVHDAGQQQVLCPHFLLPHVV